MSAYHEGELAVQHRAGVEDAARKVGAIFRDFVPEAARAFLAAQRFLVIGAEDLEGRLWASPLTGPAGFAQAVEERSLRIEDVPPASDPLHEALSAPGEHAAGLIAIEFATRRRMRVNGAARTRDGGLDFRTAQVYSNCPKYIQVRSIEAECPTSDLPATNGSALSEDQISRIEAADTLFVATLHSERGADASHRGGNPGFVRVFDEQTLVLPDYTGNNMFNTLGNMAVDPRIGLLIVDFATGDVLQISGRATIVWDAPWLESLPGAERAVMIRVEKVIDRSNALSLRWGQADLSPFNPHA